MKFNNKCVPRIIFGISSVLVFSLITQCSSTRPVQNPEPRRIILNLTEHPSTSMAVTWRTDKKVSSPQAQISVAIASPDLGKNARTVKASSESVGADSAKAVYHHSVVFDKLAPNSLYAYRVGDGGLWSEWNQFRTAEMSPEPFQFIYLGDPQNDLLSLCSRIFREAYRKAPEAGFWLITGDIVSHGGSDDEYQELFDAFGWIPRMTPMIFLPGNHDHPDYGPIKKLSHLWRPHFTLPENGPLGLEETAYFLDYQGVRIVMLNGNDKQEEQAKWLDTILTENPQRWTIVAIHQPMYSTGRERDDQERRNLFVPVFDKHSVDLVLQGHDHTYGRTFKLRNGEKVGDDQKGTVYIVSVSGPKVYQINELFRDKMVKLGTDRQLFQVIGVDGNHLKYESWTAAGELYDSFELKK